MWIKHLQLQTEYIRLKISTCSFHGTWYLSARKSDFDLLFTICPFSHTSDILNWITCGVCRICVIIHVYKELSNLLVLIWKTGGDNFHMILENILCRLRFAQSYHRNCILHLKTLGIISCSILHCQVYLLRIISQIVDLINLDYYLTSTRRMKSDVKLRMFLWI